MLARMKVGMVLTIVTQMMLMVFSMLNQNGQLNTTPCYNENVPGTACLVIQLNITYSQHQCYPVLPYSTDSTYLLFIIPQLLIGLCGMLVFMTVLEFICAQAPRTTQGMLIGIWYASFVIKYCVLETIRYFIVEDNSWYIYQLVKIFTMMLSVYIFQVKARGYCYRERDEIVPEQTMVEEIFERRIDMEEEFYAKANN